MAKKQYTKAQTAKQEPAATPSFPLTERGRTGLTQFAGIIHEEFLPQLTGPKAIRVYKEMASNDPVVSGMLFAVEMFIRQPDWFFVPPTDPSPVDIRNTEFANSLLGDMSHTWQEFLSEALTMLPFGFAPFETVYKLRRGGTGDPMTNSQHSDGRIGWRKFAIRAQDTIDRWIFDPAGGVVGLEQWIPSDGFRATLPIEKLVIFRIRPHKGNPEGTSVLRGAFRPWMFKKRIEENEAIGVERDLSGVPVVYVPAAWKSENASQAQKDAVQEYEEMVTRIRRNEATGLVLPSIRNPQTGDRDLEFLLQTTGGRRQHDTDKIVTRLDSRIAQSIQAQFTTIGVNATGGSFALASSHTHIFAIVVGAIMDTIAETINRHAMPKLWALNGLPLDRIPQLKHGDLETPDVRDLGNLLLRLSDGGYIRPEELSEEDRHRIVDRILRMVGLESPARGPTVGRPVNGGPPEPEDGGDDDRPRDRGSLQSRDVTRRNERQRNRLNRLTGTAGG